MPFASQQALPAGPPPPPRLQDIPGGHPYMLSLGILGGLYAFDNPLQGCLLVRGPGGLLLMLVSTQRWCGASAAPLASCLCRKAAGAASST